jgi:hypothetical protein
MALTGHLSDLSLSELIEFFCNQRKTGLLKVLYPQGPGYFCLQAGCVIDARIGVLRGIDAVYFALTLPNAKFEFGDATEPPERTINQPWTQVVLEGLRRLDEGIAPMTAFPPDYSEEIPAPQSVSQPEEQFTELENLRAPAFLSFANSGAVGKRKVAIAGGVAFAVVASVAAIGVPAGWYHRAKTAAITNTPATEAAAMNPATSTAPASTTEAPAPATGVQPTDHNDEAALAAKRQRDREKAKREEQAQASTKPVATAPVPTSTNDAAKAGPKKVVVTVTYDESGRVTQASGADASAIRIARQKRFPSGKAGSATITIPIN